MSLLQTVSDALHRVPEIFAECRALRRELRDLRQSVGRIELRQTALLPPETSLRGFEFQVSSQWGEDGIIQHLLRHVPIERELFVEFGVQNYTESNTRFLLVNNDWAGLVIDASAADIGFIRKDPIYWRHNLKAVESFVTRDNINELLRSHGVIGPIGLLSIDIDGNDYWVWEAIEAVQPAITIVEYNSRFGAERAVTVPYDAEFVREKAHYSQAYYGASLAALVALGKRKGHAFVGSNSAGNNAFFVRRELLKPPLRELDAAEGYVTRQFREARNAEGRLAHLSPEEEAALVNALPLVVVPT